MADADDLIRANVAQIAEAVNTQDLEKYGRSVTDDFVDINKNLRGELLSTVGRQARLDALQKAFSGPYRIHAAMDPVDVAVAGERAFALIDGTLTMTTRDGTAAFSLALDIYLFFTRDAERGWLCERSMGIEKSSTAA